MDKMDKCVFCNYNGDKKIRETDNTCTLSKTTGQTAVFLVTVVFEHAPNSTCYFLPHVINMWNSDILSNPYLLVGHCLVIPIEHYECLDEIPNNICIELFFETRNVARLLRERLGASGIDIRHNFRPFLRESQYKVNHLHFHVIPRELDDELYQKSMKHEVGVFKDFNSGLLNDLKRKLT